MSNITIFNNTALGNLRVVMGQDGEPWFVAKDVAVALGYAKPENAVAAHCKYQKTCPLESGGQVRHVTIIPESDMYRLIIRSKLPSAEKFEAWVTEEVLPSIRKHGAYATPATIESMISNPDFAIQLLTSLKDEQEKRRQLESEKAVAEAKVAELAPKASKYDAYLDATGTLNLTSAGKLFGLSGKALGEKLRKIGWLFQRTDHCLGFHSRDSRCPSAICSRVMPFVSKSLNLAALGSPCAALRFTHL